MKLYVSFEDESALNPEMAGYRAHIINYLEQLLPDDEIIGRAGCTRAESYKAVSYTHLPLPPILLE